MRIKLICSVSLKQSKNKQSMNAINLILHSLLLISIILNLLANNFKRKIETKEKTA